MARTPWSAASICHIDAAHLLLHGTLQVLRLSEEQLSGGVLDDSCVTVIARGCTQLQELELVQVRARSTFACCCRALKLAAAVQILCLLRGKALSVHAYCAAADQAIDAAS